MPISPYIQPTNQLEDHARKTKHQNNRVLHHENVPRHTAVSINEFLASKNMRVIFPYFETLKNIPGLL